MDKKDKVTKLKKLDRIGQYGQNWTKRQIDRMTNRQ